MSLHSIPLVTWARVNRNVQCYAEELSGPHEPHDTRDSQCAGRGQSDIRD